MTTSRNAKSASEQKLNRGPFSKFVNRRNTQKKVTATINKPKTSPITTKK